MPFIQFQFRRGSAAGWTSADPVLAAGEMGIETDTDQFKIGDGTSAWSVLDYGGIQGPAGEGGGIASVSADTAPALGGNLDVLSYSIGSSTGNLVLNAGMGSYVSIAGLNYPNNSGMAGQVLSSDGMGNITWAGAGISSVSADTNPSLGGDLKVNAYNIISEGGGNITLAPDTTGYSKINRMVYNEPVQSPSYSSTYAPDANAGGVVVITLTGNITINEFTNAVAGQSVTIVLKQDATGGRTLSSTALFAGADSTLSTAGGAVDILTMFYDGTDYYASLGKDFS